MIFTRDDDTKFKATLSPIGVKSILYDLADFSIIIIPSEVNSMAGNYCEIFLRSKDPDNKEKLDNLEKDIFELIKHKRGPLYDAQKDEERIAKLPDMEIDKGILIDTEINATYYRKHIWYYPMFGLIMFILLYMCFIFIDDEILNGNPSIVIILIYIGALGLFIAILYFLHVDFKTRTRVEIYTNGIIPERSPYELVRKNVDYFIKWEEISEFKVNEFKWLGQKKWWYNLHPFATIQSSQFKDNGQKVFELIQTKK